MKITNKMKLEFLFMSIMNIVLPLFIQISTHKTLIWYFYLQGIINFTSYFLVINKKMSGIYLYIVAIIITIFIDYKNQVYGDAILRIFWILPLQIKILVQHYFRTKNVDNFVEIKYHSWTKKEFVLTIVTMIIMLIMLSWNLNNIDKIPVLNLIFDKNDPYIYLDALSVVANITAQYHFSKMHKNWFYLNILADIPLVLIWMAIYFTKNESSAIVMILSNLSFAIASIYALIIEKIQEKREKEFHSFTNEH